MPKKAFFGVIVISAFFLIFVIQYFWRKNIPLISPQSLIESYIAPVSTSQKEVYAFFPYWNIKKINQLNINQVTHLAYFALDLNPDGTILKKQNKKELEPGWNKLNSPEINNLLFQVHLLKRKAILTITAMDPESIESILNDQNHQTTAIDQIIENYQKYNFDGINIDFEHIGIPDKTTRDNFTHFISKLKNTCKISNPNCEIDIDIFADTADKYRLHDLEALSSIVDRIIVMAYDYYRKNSSQAGPVAPLIGKCQDLQTSKCLVQDISSNLASILKVAPANKLLLGIPFYGYQWQTVSTDYLSNTYLGTGSLASYQRINSIFNDPSVASLSSQWSEKTLSPYLTFTQDNKQYQIHYENPLSIEQKLKFISHLGLNGIGIWALGYETPYLDIWQPIANWKSQ